jgi:hypothetical protein
LYEGHGFSRVPMSLGHTEVDENLGEYVGLGRYGPRSFRHWRN